MDISVAIQGQATPVSLNVSLTPEQLTQKIQTALANNELLELTSSEGSTLLIPISALGYVRIAKEEPRKVGFGL